MKGIGLLGVRFRLGWVPFTCIAVAATAMTPWKTLEFAQGQQPSAGVLRVTSRLVTLDVAVIDKDGKPVTDLQRGDFTIYENGTVQDLRSFEAFSTHLLPSALTSNSIQNTADLQRLLPDAPVTVLVLDEFNTAFSDNAFARETLRKYLLAQPAVLPQPMMFLVATDAGFQQAVDYTLDKERLLQALAHLPGVLPGGLMRTEGTPEGRAIRFAQTLETLEQVANATAGHRGRKNLIWVGRGFETIDLRNEPDHQVQLVKAAAEGAVNALRQAHASLYTIDPTLSTKLAGGDGVGSNPNAFTNETHNATDPFDGTVSFNTLAPESGGRAIALYNDLDVEIADSVREGSAYYGMSYVPTDAVDANHPYREIEVRVNRPGIRVITRRGYYSVTPPLPPRTPVQVLKAKGFDLGNAIGSGLTYTGLSLVAGVSPRDPAMCIVQIPTREIQWESGPEGENSAHLTLVVVAIDAKGRPIGKNVKDVMAKLGPDKKLSEIPFTTLQVVLPDVKGVTSDRVAVRDEISGKIGTAELPSSAK